MKFKNMSAIWLLFLVSCSAVNCNDEVIAEYGYEAFKMAILNSVGVKTPPNDASGLLIYLGHDDSDIARRMLVDLTNYYLGSATGEALRYSILKHGKKILPDLHEEMEKSAGCIDKNAVVAAICSTADERNALISKLIHMIKSGKKIEYVM